MNVSAFKSWTVLAYLALVLLLGGASAAGFAANALLQIGGAIVIALVIWSESLDSGLKTGGRFFFAGLAVLAVLQFVPLPPALWQILPGRDRVAEGFAIAGFSLPWLTYSLDPWSSLQSLVWCLPPLAIFLSMRSTFGPSSRQVILTIQTIAYVSVVLAIIQAISGSAYIYAVTNFGNGVGLFANSNHFGSFMLIVMALVAGQWIHDRHPAPRFNPKIHPVWLLTAQLAPLLLGIYLSDSMACILLTIPLLCGIFLISRSQTKIRWPIVGLSGIAMSGGLVWLLTSGVLTNDLADKTETAGISRGEFLNTGLKMLSDFAPVGSGIGTFRDLYSWYEQSGSVGTTFVNHAHNDLLELAIETGIAGLIVLGLFGWWYTRRVLAIWNATRSDNAVALASTLAIGAVLIHSLVDYPLRTSAISSLLALCMVLMFRNSDPKGTAAKHLQASERRESMTRI